MLWKTPLKIVYVVGLDCTPHIGVGDRATPQLLGRPWVHCGRGMVLFGARRASNGAKWWHEAPESEFGAIVGAPPGTENETFINKQDASVFHGASNGDPTGAKKAPRGLC